MLSGYFSAKENHRNILTGNKSLGKIDYHAKAGDQGLTSYCEYYSTKLVDDRIGDSREIDELIATSPLLNENGMYDWQLCKDLGYEFSETTDLYLLWEHLNKGGYALYNYSVTMTEGHSTFVNSMEKVSSGFFGIEFYKIRVADSDYYTGGSYKTPPRTGISILLIESYNGYKYY